MTNGEKLKETFPNLRITIFESYVQVMGENYEFNNAYPLEWWNAEYKEPSSSDFPTKSENPISSTTKNDSAHNLCDSCTNIGCEFQSGIVRTKCAFYMPPQLEPDNCGNYVVQAPTTKNDLVVDAVSRKAVHDMLENLPIAVEDKWFNWLQKACMRLADLPSVTVQESRWIPVSESLPKDSEPVNIIWILHAPFYKNIRDKAFTATGVYSNGQWYWWSKSCTDILEKYSHNYADILYEANKAELEAWMPYYDDIINEFIEVIAWMPLPESYKGKSD